MGFLLTEKSGVGEWVCGRCCRRSQAKAKFTFSGLFKGAIMVNPRCLTRLETRIEESDNVASGRVLWKPSVKSIQKKQRVMKVKGLIPS